MPGPLSRWPGAPEHLRAVAREIDEIGDRFTRRSMVLRWQAADVPWESAAASAMRASTGEVCHGLQRVADYCTDAAYALRRHAARVEEAELAGAQSTISGRG